MRRAGKIDDNQAGIVKALRLAGASVQILASVGKGCPDLLVGFAGKNLLLEAKDGDKSPSRRKLTPDQNNWHANWRGSVHIINNEREALRAIGLATTE